MRQLYEGRRATLRQALARHAPNIELRGLAAGFHAVAQLPDRVEEKAVISEALARGIGLYGMSEYRSTGRTGPPQLVLGFGHLSESAIDRGIAMIADLLQAKR
jgi:GntR family transcriptional regulator/MocR family aminotransferase